jgi:competence ComEA-like helix-hairpin-helix protein
MDDRPRPTESPPTPHSTRTAPLLRRNDQMALAAILIVCLLLIGCFVVRLGILKQGVIDIDQRASRDAQLQVDINIAPWSDFANLPGIGEQLGRMIVEYRDENGEFQALEEIQNVPGIGETRYRRIERYLVITFAAKKK